VSCEIDFQQIDTASMPTGLESAKDSPGIRTRSHWGFPNWIWVWDCL